ncbi:MAG: metallophosphoesterase family protein [Dehalococcoidia bacterium]|jgi:diadenosine tetraphosphatase ApaH/serine/threonine PP2A family protein phosphatase
MRYAILADIHGNLDAFRAALRDIEGRGGIDELWCLGDVVGYGPEPSACLDLLREYPHACVAGNHDWAAAGKIDTDDFNPDAAAACEWTAIQLNQSDKEYLQNLPLTLVRGDFTLAHGSPRDPLYEYIFSVVSAEYNLRSLSTAHCLVGHTHVPSVFQDSEGICRKESLPPVLRPGGRMIINPGGVGQPRDGDPRASYVVYDDAERVIYSYRVPYDIAAVQEKMRRCGLPAYLSERLSDGL